VDTAVIRSPPPNADVASAHICFTAAKFVLAPSKVAWSRPFGSLLLFDSMSTRLWIAWTMPGSPSARPVQIVVSSPFFAVTADFRSSICAGIACALVSAAAKSFFVNKSRAAAMALSTPFAWSGTYLAASALTAANASSATLSAASAGAFWFAQPAASAATSRTGISLNRCFTVSPLLPASRGRPVTTGF
jgi:hypothetical protein